MVLFFSKREEQTAIKYCVTSCILAGFRNIGGLKGNNLQLFVGKAGDVAGGAFKVYAHHVDVPAF